MKTPIYDYLVNLAKIETTRLHMPGHKGYMPFDILSEISKYDITEIVGSDSLYDPCGIILESEENTSNLYGSSHSNFSAGGSTLCIQTIISLFASPKDVIIAGRNSHTAFINSCALLDITPHWICPEYNDCFGVSGEISAKSVHNAIEAIGNPKAVYITSPDYMGCISDISGIAKVCQKYNVPLIVDNAHGAHLKFLPVDMHPISLGATICCDSAHKTLPVFTGGAYIHVSKKSHITKQEVKSKMSLFGSTSPSYLILLSLDLNNKYLAENARKDFLDLENTVSSIYEIAFSKGFDKISNRHDITKITLDAYKIGMTGNELGKYLSKYNIAYEYAATRHIVLMISPQNSINDINNIKKALSNIAPCNMLQSETINFCLPQSIMSVREATFAKKELISIDAAIGRVAAENKIKCPPGVPIIIAGEIIDTKTQKLLKKSGINLINVVE